MTTAPAETVAPSEDLIGILEKPPTPARYRDYTFEPFEVPGLITAHVPKGPSRLLEIGCGSGGLLHLFLSHTDADVVGIEPDPKRVALAHERGFNVVEGFYDEQNAARLGMFDTIVLADVIEHIADPAPVLMLARRYLRPGGRVIASVPNVAHWTLRKELLLGRWEYQPTGLMDATHLRWFTAATITRLFRAAGFASVELDWTSANWIRAYRRLPFGIGSGEQRRRHFVRAVVRRWPGLFGFQHIVVARVSA